MSGLVAYHSILPRVAPVVATTRVRRDDERATKMAASVASAVTTDGSPAATTLQALLGRTGLSGPDGVTVAGSSASETAPADPREKLQQALSTLLAALKPRDAAITARQDSPTATPGIDDAIRTILGALAPVQPAATAATAAATVTTDASGEAVAAPPLKPNLDALNRVLAHYTAQSARASTVVTLVR